MRKELVEIVRQPRLLALLVLGPFVLLLLFGAGYKDTTVELRTEFVGPEGSVYEQAVTDHVDDLDEYIDRRGFTSDRDAAVRRLEDGELDAVVVFPTDALDQILGGESAKIEVLHEKLDPIQQAAIDIASRLAVQEVNASVLSALAGGAQRVAGACRRGGRSDDAAGGGAVGGGCGRRHGGDRPTPQEPWRARCATLGS